MNKEYKKVESINGQKYMMEPMDPDLDEGYYTMGWNGRKIYQLLKEQQPERFAEMQTDKTLIPFIEKHIHQWFLNMKEHAQNNGLQFRHEAEELEWNNLIEAVGLK